MSDLTPRELTPTECRDRFITHVRSLIDFWASDRSACSGQPIGDQMAGLVHSILTAIDGSAVALPSFLLAPQPHPSDKDFHIERGEAYWPRAVLVDPGLDIAGTLHERLLKDWTPAPSRLLDQRSAP